MKTLPQQMVTLLVAYCILFCSGCVTSLVSAIHDPILPTSSQAVSYDITAESSAGIKKIQLYETINSINSSGTVTAGTESLLETWNVSGNPTTHTVTHTKASGFGSNRLVQYRVVVTNGDNKTNTETITYSTRPYPVSNMPAPAYVQGNPDDVFDIILIPDSDITNMNTFRDNCSEIILNSIHREPTMRVFSHQFNFYINPLTGTATDFDRRSTDGNHQMPTNNANLTFAEVRVLMHQNTLRDYAMAGGIFSTEWDRPQTFIHEGGHAMFGLRDEYCLSTCREQAEIPNIWKLRADAEAAAPDYGKTVSDVTRICSASGTDCFKICGTSCPMRSGSALLFNYDRPCEDRVIFEIFNNALK